MKRPFLLYPESAIQQSNRRRPVEFSARHIPMQSRSCLSDGAVIAQIFDAAAGNGETLHGSLSHMIPSRMSPDRSPGRGPTGHDLPAGILERLRRFRAPFKNCGIQV